MPNINEKSTFIVSWELDTSPMDTVRYIPRVCCGARFVFGNFHDRRSTSIRIGYHFRGQEIEKVGNITWGV